MPEVIVVMVVLVVVVVAAAAAAAAASSRTDIILSFTLLCVVGSYSYMRSLHFAL
jgi:hypothetical protein